MLLCLLLGGGAIASAATRAQAGPPQPRPAVQQAEVEISEAAAGGATLTMRFVLGLTDNELSQIKAQTGDVHYVLKLRLDTRHSGQSLLSCDAERIELGAARAPARPSSATTLSHAVRDVHVRAAAVAGLGRRLTLARVARPDGSRFELAVTLR